MTSADSYISSHTPRKQCWRQSFDVKEVLSLDASGEDQTGLKGKRRESKPWMMHYTLDSVPQTTANTSWLLIMSSRCAIPCLSATHKR